MFTFLCCGEHLARRLAAEFPCSLFFGSEKVVDGYMVSPIMFSPGFLTGACTYNGLLTLTAGFYESTVRREAVRRFLDRMVDEFTGQININEMEICL